LSRTLNVLALLAGVASSLASVWIVVPAPAYSLWLVAVAASEWGLYLAALGAFGIVCALSTRAVSGGVLWLPSLIAGSLAVVFGLYPLASAMVVARAHGVSLSLGRYTDGLVGRVTGSVSEDERGPFTTHTYATVEGRELRLDAYLPPAGVVQSGAAVIVVHGGSWGGGERSDFPRWNHWLAGEGFAVFDVDYRLSPQPNWLAATGDVKCAVAWVKRHAEEFRVSPDRLALLGRSAGGHLALLAAYTADDTRLPPSCSGQASGEESVPTAAGETGVRAAISLYGPTDLVWAYDNPANMRVLDGPETLRRFLGVRPHESGETLERYMLASPTAHVTPRTPPTLLVHGGHDQLVRAENMERLALRLEESRVPHRAVFLAYAQHGFDYNFNGWGSQVFRPVLLDFLREHTGPR
jgi:acetyl esterase/lipase